MASITIRNLDDAVKAQLRMRAARHGRSMEDEARVILRAVLDQPNTGDTRELVERIRRRMQALGGGVDLPIPPREPIREPPTFD